MKSSHGRHGGNRGKTDKGEARNRQQQAALNTDVDSRRTARDKDEAEGHTAGKK